MWLSGGRTWWAHFEFTRINIEPTILRKKIEERRVVGAYSAINGPNQQERSLESIRIRPNAYTLACEEASPDEPHTEERIREA